MNYDDPTRDQTEELRQGLMAGARGRQKRRLMVRALSAHTGGIRPVGFQLQRRATLSYRTRRHHCEERRLQLYQQQLRRGAFACEGSQNATSTVILRVLPWMFRRRHSNCALTQRIFVVGGYVLSGYRALDLTTNLVMTSGVTE